MDEDLKKKLFATPRPKGERKLDPEKKREWLRALESGRIAQCKDQLRFFDIEKKTESLLTTSTHYFNGTLDRESHIWVPGNHRKGQVHGLGPKTRRHLAAMNDAGFDFPTIAKWIRREL